MADMTHEEKATDLASLRSREIYNIIVDRKLYRIFFNIIVYRKLFIIVYRKS